MKNKIYSLNSLQKILKNDKKKSLKIVLCHGVFDLVHYGHILHFKTAKELGDILIVSITKDKFIKIIAGKCEIGFVFYKIILNLKVY